MSNKYKLSHGFLNIEQVLYFNTMYSKMLPACDVRKFTLLVSFYNFIFIFYALAYFGMILVFSTKVNANHYWQKATFCCAMLMKTNICAFSTYQTATFSEMLI